ncbi:hypothetical protein AVEN_163067-1 [Araneus ventricosus]|uniref:Uncharacterized protein n=1 Tax=Araneus ventricosus TaxID=182803 RepID=A0A4Y2P1Q5_ARAVE|nr:hypothetical protein AVEN_163067-1 [Araneus ventricosus]
MLMYPIVLSAPQFQLHKLLWIAASSTVGLHVERRHHLQSVCLQDVVLVDQTDENRLVLSLVKRISRRILLGPPDGSHNQDHFRNCLYNTSESVSEETDGNRSRSRVSVCDVLVPGRTRSCERRISFCAVFAEEAAIVNGKRKRDAPLSKIPDKDLLLLISSLPCIRFKNCLRATRGDLSLCYASQGHSLDDLLQGFCYDLMTHLLQQWWHAF